MQTEELLVNVIFHNQMVFCGIFGGFGGVVHILDLRIKLNVSMLISKIIISSIAGLLLFFATYDINNITPSLRIAASIVTGFYGSALFRYLAKFYMKQMFTNIPIEPKDDMTDKPDSTDEEENTDDSK